MKLIISIACLLIISIVEQKQFEAMFSKIIQNPALVSSTIVFLAIFSSIFSDQNQKKAISFLIGVLLFTSYANVIFDKYNNFYKDINNKKEEALKSIKEERNKLLNLKLNINCKKPNNDKEIIYYMDCKKRESYEVKNIEFMKEKIEESINSYRKEILLLEEKKIDLHEIILRVIIALAVSFIFTIVISTSSQELQFFFESKKRKNKEEINLSLEEKINLLYNKNKKAKEIASELRIPVSSTYYKLKKMELKK